MATGNQCIDRLVAEGRVTESEGIEIFRSMQRLVAAWAEQDKTKSPETLLAEIERGLTERETILNKVAKRNTLLNIRAKNNLKAFVSQFRTAGEGLRAYMEGSVKNVKSARLSVDAQAKAIHGQFFANLTGQLEESGVLKDFMRGKLEKEIFIEMAEIKPGGKPGRSGSKSARKIAEILHNHMGEMVTRQNSAGAFITLLPGYIMRQTHDMTRIRQAGGNNLDPEVSFQNWKRFIMPKLDKVKTFNGADPDKYLRLVHDALFTGTHGKGPEAEISYSSVYASTANKLSSKRVLHFKDAEGAFQYNQEFGLRSLRDAVFSDLHYRSRNIAAMENLGPNPEATWRQAIRELSDETRETALKGEHADSIRDWRVEASYRTALGLDDIPTSVTFHRRMSAIRLLAQLSKMGGVVVTSITDKAFMQSELAFNGVKYLDAFGAQVKAFLPKDQKKLRAWGVMIDGLIGNTISRFALHDTTTGMLHRAQRKFFDLNFLNWWTDNHKGAAAEVLINHLGEHAEMSWKKLPAELTRVLSLYGIKDSEWNAIRSTVSRDLKGNAWIYPEKLREIDSKLIQNILAERGLADTKINEFRVKNQLETAIRAWLTDRVDYAIPTPGAATKKYMTLGSKAGEPLGEFMRTLTIFKSFPVTILSKILARDFHGRGATGLADWIKTDHMGKFWIAHTIAATTVLGYISGVIKDAMRGKTPKQLVDDEGNINWATLNDAALRGGGLGIMGDVLLAEYDRGSRSFLNTAAGPVFGQTETLAQVATKGVRGENVLKPAQKFFQDNIPYINLFYIRPILDYFVLWNLQEMLEPGSMEAYENRIQEEYGQEFFLDYD